MSSPDAGHSPSVEDTSARLKGLNAVRLSWYFPRQTKWKTVGLCAAMGAWGVLSGYAVFILPPVQDRRGGMMAVRRYR